MSLSKLFIEASESSKNFKDSKSWLETLVSMLEAEMRFRNDKPYILLNPSKCRELIVYGDIHGDLSTLLQLGKISNLDEVLERGGYVLFLGDYIDRGPYQLETLILLSMIKRVYGDKVILLRGNHEPPEWLTPYPHDYIYRLVERFGRDKGLELYEISKEIFKKLPLAAVLKNQALFVHGGPPIIRSKSAGNVDELLDVRGDAIALEEILWSDPAEIESEWEPSPRGAGKIYGERITKRVLEILKIGIIVRAHEPCNYGFKLNHGGRVLTLFSLKGYPYFNIDAAVLKVSPLEDPEWFKNIAKYVLTTESTGRIRASSIIESSENEY